MKMPQYEDKDPKGWCGNPARGAAMGRHSYHPAYEFPNHQVVKLRLVKIRLDNGGYDRLGTYWGGGNPIYWYASVDGAIDDCLRARNRDDARAQILRKYPNARFFN